MKRHHYWITSIGSSVILIAAALVYMHKHVDLDISFPVEELKITGASIEFVDAGIIPEECISVAHEVRQHEWRSVSRVIVDRRNPSRRIAYAFVGSKQGTVYGLSPEGIDSWRIVSQSTWNGSPREHVLHIQEPEGGGGQPATRSESK
jgi:hypothetical protein